MLNVIKTNWEQSRSEELYTTTGHGLIVTYFSVWIIYCWHQLQHRSDLFRREITKSLYLFWGENGWDSVFVCVFNVRCVIRPQYTLAWCNFPELEYYYELKKMYRKKHTTFIQCFFIIHSDVTQQLIWRWSLVTTPAPPLRRAGKRSIYIWSPDVSQWSVCVSVVKTSSS